MSKMFLVDQNCKKHFETSNPIYYRKLRGKKSILDIQNFFIYLKYFQRVKTNLDLTDGTGNSYAFIYCLMAPESQFRSDLEL